MRAIAKEVEPAVFGLYAFVLQITGYLVILQLGLDMAVSRQVAESLGRDDESDARRAYGELIRFNQLATWGCLTLAVSVAAVLWINRDAGSAYADLPARIAILTGLAQALSFRARSPAAALIGSQFLAPTDVYFARAADQTPVQRPPILDYVGTPWPTDVMGYALAVALLLPPVWRGARRRR